MPYPSDDVIRIMAANGFSPESHPQMYDTLLTAAMDAANAGAPVAAVLQAVEEVAVQERAAEAQREQGRLDLQNASIFEKLPPGWSLGQNLTGGGDLTYEQVKAQIPVGTSLIGSPSSPVLQAINDSGKVVATFYQDPATGNYIPDFVLDDGGTGSGGSGGGGGGGGGSTGPTAFDLAQIERSNFETDREYNEAVRQFDLKFGEDARQFNTSLGENARQFDATNTRLNLADVGNLGVDLGNLNLEQQKYIAQILREPADFLARAFTQRGGQSPFPEITQADLINKLSSEFDRIRGFVGGEMGKRPGGSVVPAPGKLNLQPQAGANGLITLPGGITWNPANGPMPDHLTWGAPGVGTTPGTVSDPGFTQQAFNEAGEAESYNPAYGTPANVAPGTEYADTQNTGFNFRVDETGTLRAYEDGTGGPARNRLSLVGEDGPELMINHGDGSFDIVSNDDLKALSKGTTKPKQYQKGADDIEQYEAGTLSGLSPDALGRLSLFDVAAVPRTTQGQLLDYARTATPPGVAAVAGGTSIPNLDVTRGSSFALFSPQQYAALTPDEQAALGTRLASENKSLSDFLYSSQRNFVGRPRQQRRARLDITS